MKQKGMLFIFLSFFFLYISCNQTAQNNDLLFTHTDSLDLFSKNQRALASIRKMKPLISQGDMILRTGNDFTSESLRQLSTQDKTYSHCGIASIEHDSVFVYHSLGGEWNPDEKLRRDPVEKFCAPEGNRGFGIFTFNFNSQQKHDLDSIVRSWYRKGLMFDMSFDLSTDDRMYCAEFVSKAINVATNKKIIFPTTTINRFQYVAVDNLFLNQYCTEKKRVLFQ